MLLMDANGDIIKSIAKEYPIYFPQNGWSEQDPQDWWNAVKAGIQEITVINRISKVYFGGQMHGMLEYQR